MKSKKAFTLLELTIVLAVVAIATLCVAVVYAQANAFFVSKKTSSARQSELISFQSAFDSELQNFQSASFVVTPCENQNNIVFTSGQNQTTISFYDQTLWHNQTPVKEFRYIQDVTFNVKNNFIQCNLVFDQDYTQKLVFLKRI